ncbi:MAG: exosortase system-associated protein, TIGR04073 family [Candidatus Omnitrophota bacterium]|nr:exosortase system-associated protein, TIGR04073 family [Candidatus Omnitrophota bacterium]
MKKFITVFFVIIMVLSFSVSVFAADIPKSPAKTTAYPAGPVQKAERGFSNLAFGWTEIPKRIVDKSKETNPIQGLFLGLFQGTCKAFARTVSGAADLVTFPLGGYDKPAVLPDMPAAK